MLKILIITLGIISFCNGQALAMLCKANKVENLYRKAEVVFEAKVRQRMVSTEEDAQFCWNYSEGYPKCGPKIATLNVTKVWKGNLKVSPKIFSEDACYCLGAYLDVNDEYVIFANFANKEKPYDLVKSSFCGSIRLKKYYLKEIKEIENLSR